MPVPRDPARRLAACQRRYRALAEQLAHVGAIHGGSLVRRYTGCANPHCHCRADPPAWHGPYWQWTVKVGSPTVSRRLSDDEAALHREWIANDRQPRQLVAQMQHVAHAAPTSPSAAASPRPVPAGALEVKVARSVQLTHPSGAVTAVLGPRRAPPASTAAYPYPQALRDAPAEPAICHRDSPFPLIETELTASSPRARSAV